MYISLISDVDCLHVPVDHLCPPWISEIRWNWPSRLHQSTILHHSTILFPTLFWLLDSYPLKNWIIFWWVLLPWIHSVQLTWLDINLFKKNIHWVLAMYWALSSYWLKQCTRWSHWGNRHKIIIIAHSSFFWIF